MRHPIYLDGPWKGTDHPIGEGFDHVVVPVIPPIEGMLSGDSGPYQIVYRLRQFHIFSGGSQFSLWFAYRGPYEPSVELLVDAIFKPEVIAMGELELPPITE